jgi:hypothetical protein
MPTITNRLTFFSAVQYKFMAKLKPAGTGKKTPAKSARSAIPCLILVLLGIAGMCLLFYLSLKSSGTS